MLKAKELDVPLSFHEEDPAFISENGIHAGEAAKRWGSRALRPWQRMHWWPRDACWPSIQVRLVNIQHISSCKFAVHGEAGEGIGSRCTAEVTPHHFTSHRGAVLEHGAMAKMTAAAYRKATDWELSRDRGFRSIDT